MIDLHDGDYILGMWVVEVIGNVNWCMHAVKRKSGEWDVGCRFRFIEDDKIFGSKDRKKFFTADVSLIKDDEGIEKFCDDQYQHYIKCVMLENPDEKIECEHLEIRGDITRFAEMLGSSKFFHAKELTKKEIEEMKGGEDDTDRI